MNLNDILQVVFLSAVIFFCLGYWARPRFYRWWQALQRFFLSPRYLKVESVWQRDNFSSSNKKSS